MITDLSFARPRVMGIVNVTPDSFSGDGILQHENYIIKAVQQAVDMVQNGADILDIGGESSRPGAASITPDEEMRRVVPVIRALRAQGITTPIAIDTTKAKVAIAALEAGVDIVNDISALEHDAAMAGVVARHKAWVVLMHNRGDAESVTHDAKLGGTYQAPVYQNVVADVVDALCERIEMARAAGIAPDKIILDPGLGFGKTVEQNLALINRLDDIKKLGYPVLLGPSRKGFIGHVLDLPVGERLEGTAACVAVGLIRGADIVRVHDVKFMARLVKMTDSLRKA